MNHLISLCAMIIRLLRPSDGLHADPCGYFRAVASEVRRRRSTRVRRFAPSAPATTQSSTEPAPLVPAPRKPADARPARTALSAMVPVVDPREVEPPAAMVRPGYRAYERQMAHPAVDRDWLGIVVPLDLSNITERAA
ncbi:hypothetical protein GCM10007147_42960 [Nocardiopsis kunsanensis]|uniref:Uncharacterized protein n=1 Tax=Nocardiopsis kunsanensis TaxID=141693 RepID=A0A918XLA8_9ACTN|nr:hypothetical protein [Nocardiopsis kunsanensis]GHD36025.1 hypothetical protein GCM10007147_42960 [Nocardiopsis kunsanensis]